MTEFASDPRLALTVGGVKFKNPFFLASGPTTHSVDQIVRGCELGWAGASIKLTFDPPPYINRVPSLRLLRGAGQGFLSFTAEKRLAFEQGLQLVRDSLPQGEQRLRHHGELQLCRRGRGSRGLGEHGEGLRAGRRARARGQPRLPQHVLQPPTHRRH